MVRNNNRRNVVVVNPGARLVQPNVASGNPVRTARNRRRRAARAVRRAELLSDGRGVGFSNPNTSGSKLAAMQSMNAGRMTADVESDVGFIRSIQCGFCEIGDETLGWYNKYIDPAGSVEVGNTTGMIAGIPDGLPTFSVSAEIRTIDTLPVPDIEDDGIPGNLPLTGATWSLTIFSYPLFRTAYIAVANRFDKEISNAVAGELAYTLNNLTDYRATIDLDDWSPFALNVEDGWFFWVKPLPPTYNLPDPLVGDVRTLASWRMTYKSLTIEHNAPTLVDQGFWNGGHYALESNPVAQSVVETTMVSSYIHGITLVPVNVTVMPSALRYTIAIPNLPQIGAVTGNAFPVLSSSTFKITTNGDTTSAGVPASWVVANDTFWYNPFEVQFAGPGDTVTMTQSTSGNNILITFTSSLALSVPIVLTFVGNSFGGIAIGTQGVVKFFVDNDDLDAGARSANSIEFPAFTPSQIAANNPKMEQFLMKETNGAYIVHKKMLRPVFEFTPAATRGPLQFSTVGYSDRRNTNDGSGILDSLDANFSTASVCVRGIAHANVIVVKLYQGWEGVTNVNTPFGQFGRSGVPRNNSVMELVDNITVRTTGVYPANDNFLGLISQFAMNALRGLLTSQATPTLLGNLAQGAINKGLTYANNRLTRAQRRAALARGGDVSLSMARY